MCLVDDDDNGNGIPDHLEDSDGNGIPDHLDDDDDDNDGDGSREFSLVIHDTVCYT